MKTNLIIDHFSSGGRFINTESLLSYMLLTYYDADDEELDSVENVLKSIAKHAHLKEHFNALRAMCDENREDIFIRIDQEDGSCLIVPSLAKIEIKVHDYVAGKSFPDYALSEGPSVESVLSPTFKLYETENPEGNIRYGCIVTCAGLDSISDSGLSKIRHRAVSKMHADGFNHIRYGYDKDEVPYTKFEFVTSGDNVFIDSDYYNEEVKNNPDYKIDPVKFAEEGARVITDAITEAAAEVMENK